MEFIKGLLTKYGITNVGGTITAILGMAIYGMDQWLGCNIADVVATTTDTATVCQLPSWFPAKWATTAIGIAGGIAFVSKLMRPGTWLRNLFGATAVVVPKEVIEAKGIDPKGVVTPGQVASTSAAAK